MTTSGIQVRDIYFNLSKDHDHKIWFGIFKTKPKAKVNDEFSLELRRNDWTIKQRGNGD